MISDPATIPIFFTNMVSSTPSVRTATLADAASAQWTSQFTTGEPRQRPSNQRGPVTLRSLSRPVGCQGGGAAPWRTRRSRDLSAGCPEPRVPAPVAAGVYSCSSRVDRPPHPAFGLPGSTKPAAAATCPASDSVPHPKPNTPRSTSDRPAARTREVQHRIPNVVGQWRSRALGFAGHAEGHAVQPTGQRTVLAQDLELLGEYQKGGLESVLCVLWVWQHAAADTVNHCPVAEHDWPRRADSSRVASTLSTSWRSDSRPRSSAATPRVQRIGEENHPHLAVVVPVDTPARLSPM